MIVAVLLLASGCSFFEPSASEACGRAAAERDPQATVAAAYATTVGRVRTMLPTEMGVVAGGATDGVRAYLCYLDGEIPKGPPPAANGAIQPPFDRAVVVVIDEKHTLVMAGYRDNLPIRTP